MARLVGGIQNALLRIGNRETLANAVMDDFDRENECNLLCTWLRVCRLRLYSNSAFL